MRPFGRFPGPLAACVIAALAVPGVSAAALQLKGISFRDYPIVRTIVLAPSESTPAPALTENGAGVESYTAEKLKAKSLLLAIDRSQSMRGAPLAQAEAAARRFVGTKPYDDRIAVVSFGRHAFQLTSFSSSTIDADQALRTLAVDSRVGTALYDAVVLGSRALGSESTKAKILVILTDGRDVSSAATLGDAIAIARRNRVAVYPIGILGPQFTPAVLRRLARATAGTYYPAHSLTDLPGIYSRIAAELRRTWLLEYVTPARPGEAIAIRVSARGAGQATARPTIPTSVGGAAIGEAAKGKRSWGGAIIIGLLTGGLLFGAVWLALGVPRLAVVQRRLAPYLEGEAREARARRADGRRVALAGPLFRATERAFAEVRLWSALELQLARAAVPLRTVEFVYLMFACGLLPALIAAVSGQSTAVILVLFVLGVAAPYAAVSIKAARRRREFDRQLPDALNTIAAALKSGHSFLQSLQTLVEEGAPPIATEFRRALTEQRLGRPLEEALLDMGRRVGSRELDFMLRAVVIQRQVGGSLAGLFEIVADTVSQRLLFRAKIKSVTAMGRMSAAILLLLPFAVAGLMTLINAEYLRPLLHTGVGQTMIAIMLVMMLIGALVIRRIVNVKA